MTSHNDKNQELIPVTDYFRLVILDLAGVSPAKTEWTGRFWAYYPRSAAEEVLTKYESGELMVPARDFVAVIQRTKNRIFEQERIERRGVSTHEYIPKYPPLP